LSKKAPSGRTTKQPKRPRDDAPAPRRGWAAREGLPYPLGVTFVEDEQAYNFALYSKHAAGVTLLLYGADDPANPLVTVPLSHLTSKSGRIWHCRLPADRLRDVRYYAYQVDGPPPHGPYEWHRFDAHKVLLDPYAHAVYFPPDFDREAARHPGSNAGRAPLGVIRPNGNCVPHTPPPGLRHEHDLVIYEMHVRGFTRDPSSGLPDDLRGTFRGVVEKIPHLLELGVTAVELMPVFQYDPQEGSTWGYMPLSFFSPHHGYAMDAEHCGQHREFRAMVDALHEAGLEVILDVVYNHTAEGNAEGPVYSFKGVDNSTYYLVGRDGRYLDFSGTGNTLHCANRYVRKMILDSLRYWVREMHVDGFRFDLASIFTRDSTGAIDAADPPIFGDIGSDPELAGVRLIAEPWDAAGAYQIGRAFPGTRWLQWNGAFRDDIRRFVRGDAGMITTLMTRLYGSDDLFPDTQLEAYHAFQSINYVTSHDGFTLYDLVSYNQKHNAANGHDNTDGPAENYSWNCGHEGDDGAPEEVRALRRRQARNLLCLALLANGTPMLRAGDEFLQTQGGNTNPYNQDNPTWWLDWRRLETHADFFRFARLMIAFRKAHPSLARSRFWRDDVSWFGPTGPVDMSAESRTLGLLLRGAAESDCDLFVMVNADPAGVRFNLPTDTGPWRRVVDTARPSPDDIRDPGDEVPVTDPHYDVGGRAVVVLMSCSS
jgi:isoamylase